MWVCRWWVNCICAQDGAFKKREMKIDGKRKGYCVGHLVIVQMSLAAVSAWRCYGRKAINIQAEPEYNMFFFFQEQSGKHCHYANGHYTTLGPQMFLDYNSRKSWSAQLVGTATGTSRTSGDWLKIKPMGWFVDCDDVITPYQCPHKLSVHVCIQWMLNHSPGFKIGGNCGSARSEINGIVFIVDLISWFISVMVWKNVFMSSFVWIS